MEGPKSLEHSSVTALVEASDNPGAQPVPEELFHSHLAKTWATLPSAKQRKRRNRYIQPCLRLNAGLCSRLSKVRMKHISLGEDSQIPALAPTVELFKAFAWNSPQATKCKCVFLGGAGFKSTNCCLPCDSRLCVNRCRSKFESTLKVAGGSEPLIESVNNRVTHASCWFPLRGQKPRVLVSRGGFVQEDSEVQIAPRPKTRGARLCLRTANQKQRKQADTDANLSSLLLARSYARKGHIIEKTQWWPGADRAALPNKIEFSYSFGG